MGNLKILSFGDTEILTGKVVSKQEARQINGYILRPMIISNKSYSASDGCMKETQKMVILSDKMNNLHIADEYQIGDRIHLKCKINKAGQSFVEEVSNHPAWKITDGQSVMNVFYGLSKIISEDERHVSVGVDGSENVITFWNDIGKPNAEKLKKAFGNNERSCYFVTGAEKQYNDTKEYRGYWFICD